MTSLTPAAVNHARAVVTWALRAAGVLLVAAGTYLAVKKLAFGVGSGDFEMAYRVWEDTGEGHSLYRGIAMLLLGTALGALSGRLASWIVVVPARDCPSCGYRAETAARSACPECGLPGVVSKPDAPA